MSFNTTPVASGYQEIHPYSAMNIDSVKINTSLIIMKECMVLHCWLRRAGCISQDTYLLYIIINKQQFREGIATPSPRWAYDRFGVRTMEFSYQVLRTGRGCYYPSAVFQ